MGHGVTLVPASLTGYARSNRRAGRAAARAASPSVEAAVLWRRHEAPIRRAGPVPARRFVDPRAGPARAPALAGSARRCGGNVEADAVCGDVGRNGFSGSVRGPGRRTVLSGLCAARARPPRPAAAGGPPARLRADGHRVRGRDRLQTGSPTGTGFRRGLSAAEHVEAIGRAAGAGTSAAHQRRGTGEPADPRLDPPPRFVGEETRWHINHPGGCTSRACPRVGAWH